MKEPYTGMVLYENNRTAESRHLGDYYVRICEDLGGDGTERRRGREAEGSRPDGMDPTDEQHPEPRGRDRSEGIGVQLIPEEALEDIDENRTVDNRVIDLTSESSADSGSGPGSAEAVEAEIQKTSEAEDTRSPAFFMPPITVFPSGSSFIFFVSVASSSIMW